MNLFVVADPIIDRGMQLAAAAKTLGLTPDEAMAIVARGQAKAAKRRGVDIPTDQVIDGFIKRAAGVGKVNADMPADIDEFRTSVWESAYIFTVPGLNDDDPMIYEDYSGKTRVVASSK